MGTIKGMEAVITALITGLTPDKFFTVIAQSIPFVVVLVPVALGFMILRRLIKGAGRGKVKF